MKFLIETDKNNNIVHDFSFELIKAIDYHNWISQSNDYKFELLNDKTIINDGLVKNNYIPIGSVEFVLHYINKFYPKIKIKPKNVPETLFKYAGRKIYNANSNDFVLSELKRHYIKSNDIIKCEFNGFTKYLKGYLPDGNYQISELITIESEWRCFVYQKKLVGLQNYLGEFTLFPNVDIIKEIIENYIDAPIAYTLDIGISGDKTFVIEVHDFFSCGLYGFRDHRILPQMFNRWFIENVKFSWTSKLC